MCLNCSLVRVSSKARAAAKFESNLRAGCCLLMICPTLLQRDRRGVLLKQLFQRDQRCSNKRCNTAIRKILLTPLKLTFDVEPLQCLLVIYIYRTLLASLFKRLSPPCCTVCRLSGASIANSQDAFRMSSLASDVKRSNKLLQNCGPKMSSENAGLPSKLFMPRVIWAHRRL